MHWHRRAVARQHLVETGQRQAVGIFDREQHGEKVGASVAFGQLLPP